jgi:hypothetical protein
MFIYIINEYYKPNTIFSSNIFPDTTLEFNNIIPIVTQTVNINNIINLLKENNYIIFKFDYIEDMQVYYIILDKKYTNNHIYHELVKGFDIVYLIYSFNFIFIVIRPIKCII